MYYSKYITHLQSGNQIDIDLIEVLPMFYEVLNNKTIYVKRINLLHNLATCFDPYRGINQ